MFKTILKSVSPTPVRQFTNFSNLSSSQCLFLKKKKIILSIRDNASRPHLYNLCRTRIMEEGRQIPEYLDKISNSLTITSTKLFTCHLFELNNHRRKFLVLGGNFFFQKNLALSIFLFLEKFMRLMF